MPEQFTIKGKARNGVGNLNVTIEDGAVITRMQLAPYIGWCLRLFSAETIASAEVHFMPADADKPFRGMAIKGRDDRPNRIELWCDVSKVEESFPTSNLHSSSRLMKRGTTEAEAMKEVVRLTAKGIPAYPTREIGRGSGVRWRITKVHPYGGERAPLIHYADFNEYLICLFCHEMRHIEQFNAGRPLSEIDCERFSLICLRYYQSHTAGQLADRPATRKDDAA